MTKHLTTLNKRAFLKTGLAAAALSTPFVNRAWANTVELTMLGWFGTAEPDMVGEFEEANNVKFVPKYYAGGDNMLAALAQNPPGTFDIIHTDAEYAKLLVANDLVMELDPSAYAYDDMLHEDFTKFAGHWGPDGKLYSLITRFGHLGVSYNKDVLTAEEASTYEVFWSPKVTGKVGHFDWHLPSLGQMSLLTGNPSPFDIDDAAWSAVQDKTLSLKPQVGGYFDFGGTFAGLKNGEMLAMCGIGDWVTGILERDGAPVSSVVPQEGGIQWTESYSIAATSEKKDMALKYLAYTLSPQGQVKTAQMLAYPGHCVTQAGRALLNEMDPAEAARSHQVNGDPQDPITLINEGRISYRDIPVQQSLEDWNDFWSEYKNA
ncbi:ABC transporter substrate-binding protein [Pseudaestuariivita sp.]|uniref:ABC transporter substrate-binding protein n=1 Tax=Pseudaestuariivita sp. TaxID=2211669 RepID=UPI00405A22BB